MVADGKKHFRLSYLPRRLFSGFVFFALSLFSYSGSIIMDTLTSLLSVKISYADLLNSSPLYFFYCIFIAFFGHAEEKRALDISSDNSRGARH